MDTSRLLEIADRLEHKSIDLNDGTLSDYATEIRVMVAAEDAREEIARAFRASGTWKR